MICYNRYRSYVCNFHKGCYAMYILQVRVGGFAHWSEEKRSADRAELVKICEDYLRETPTEQLFGVWQKHFRILNEQGGIVYQQ